MTRRASNIRTVASLMLCIATAGIWIRSYWTQTLWGCYRISDDRVVTFFSYTGHVGVCNGYYVGETPNPIQGWFEGPAYAREFHSEDWACLGFFAEFDQWWGITVPDYFICLITAIPPLLWLRSFRRRRLARVRGLCPTCGYDLRASGDRCPECGTPIPFPLATP